MKEELSELIHSMEEYAERLEHRETQTGLLRWIETQERGGDEEEEPIDWDSLRELELEACEQLGVDPDTAKCPEKKPILSTERPQHYEIEPSMPDPRFSPKPHLPILWALATVGSLILSILTIPTTRGTITGVIFGILLFPLALSALIWSAIKLHCEIGLYNLRKESWEGMWRSYRTDKESQREWEERSLAEWRRRLPEIVEENREAEEYNRDVYPEKLRKYRNVVRVERSILNKRLSRAEEELSPYGDWIPEEYRNSESVRGIAEILSGNRAETLEKAIEVWRSDMEQMEDDWDDSDWESPEEPCEEDWRGSEYV